MATYMLHDAVAKIIVFHAQLDQVNTYNYNCNCRLLMTIIIKEVFVGAGHNPTLLHIPDIPFKHPGDKSHREANL